MATPRRALTVVGRTATARRLPDGWGIRPIAGGLGRSAGTISDEVTRHGSSPGHEAVAATGRKAA